MEMTNDNNFIAAIKASKRATIAGWITSFAGAFACFAALSMGLKAGWELNLTPAVMAGVIGGSWLLGIAAGGYASLFWKRLLTAKGRAAMLVAAAWMAGALASVDDGRFYLVLLGGVGMISAAMYASQLRPRATAQGVIVATVWALAGAFAAMTLIPAFYNFLVATNMGTVGAWRMGLVPPASLLLVVSVAGYHLTRGSTAKSMVADTVTSEETDSLPAMAAAA